MRFIRLCILCLLAVISLTGCMTNKSSSCFPGLRCNEYQSYNRCGSYLTYECEDICARCHANEPTCTSCWNCLASMPESCIYSRVNGGRCSGAQYG